MIATENGIYIVQTGFRFSRNAAIPSRKSAVSVPVRWLPAPPQSRHPAMPYFAPPSGAWWLPGTSDCSQAEHLPAPERAAPALPAAQPHSPTPAAAPLPHRRAGRVNSRSRLRLSPICKARKADTSAGTKPIRASVNPNFAAGVARVKSQIMAKPVPPAIAAPCTAAMVGIGNS